MPGKKQQCHFCASTMRSVDYKDIETLKKFLSPQSKILPRNKTFVCSTHQRKLARAIKRARQMAILPFVTH